MDDQPETPSPPAPDSPDPVPGIPPKPGQSAAPVRPPDPCEALEALDRQWSDPTPIRERSGALGVLHLSVEDDAEPWDYLTALTGAPRREHRRVLRAWLAAQLAADATALGRARRPLVCLAPAARLWHVVRESGSELVAVDGPGMQSPRAAVAAAAARYRVEAVRDGARALQAGEGARP